MGRTTEREETCRQTKTWCVPLRVYLYNHKERYPLLELSNEIAAEDET